MFRQSALTTLCSVIVACAADAVVFENAHTRFVIGSNAVWKEIADKRVDRNFCFTATPTPFAIVRIAGKMFPAESLSRHGDELTVRFKGTPAVATYRVECGRDWIAIELTGVPGAEVEMIEFLRVPVAITERIGRRLNIAWNDDQAVCVAATNFQTDCGGSNAKSHASLAARAHRQFGFTGPKAVVLCGPPVEMKPLLRKVSVAFDLPRNEKNGVPSKDLPMARASYWFLGGINERNVDEVVRYGQMSGIKQLMMSQGCWSKTTGRYLFNANYPDGQTGLKRVIEKLHRAGFLVGMHTFVSKVSKSDPFVTPVPDKRFWKDQTAALAADVDAAQTSIVAAWVLTNWPASPLCKQKYWEGGITKHQDAIIDDEIIQYEAIGPDGKNDTFLRCKRGAYGTKAAPHKAGAPIFHFGVDGCINGYIIDQETDLLAEVASRNAAIFNDCGFDMVYFDGGEDIPRPHYWHYVSKFQKAAMDRYRKRPMIHMGTIMTHLLWHSFTRSGTVDTYLNTLHGHIIAGASIEKWPTVRDHIDHSVRYMLQCEQDMLPGELGWFGIWPKGKNTDGLQLDEIEYLMAKSLAYDAPISLETSFREMESHPLTPGVLEIVRAYETLRMSGRADKATRGRLKEFGRDFAMIQHGGRRDFVGMTVVPKVGGTNEVRALVGELNGQAVATLWHYIREGEVRLTLNAEKVRLLDFAGRDVAFRRDGGMLKIPVSVRRYTLLCEGVTKSELTKALEHAKAEAMPLARLWIPAAKFTRCEGKMALGSAVGLKDDGTLSGELVVCTGAPKVQTKQEWFCEYTVDIPRKAVWSVWARLRYPTGGDMSFAFVPAGETLTLSGSQALGNSGRNEGRWHWDGQGGGVRSAPGSHARQVKLDKGPFAFRIYAREGPGRTAVNPRLDMICLSEDAAYVPNDEDAKASLFPVGGRRP